MEPGDYSSQQLSTLYLFSVLKGSFLHRGFLLLITTVTLYGSWLYASRYFLGEQYEQVSRRDLIQPGRVTAGFEHALTDELSRESHWTLKTFADAKEYVLKTGITRQVMPGKAGWLFLQQEDDRPVIQQSLGVYQYTPYALKQWSLLIRQRQFWTKQQGKDYLMVIAPNKSTIYPEFLPERFHPLSGNRTREQLQRALSNVRIIDLTDSLLARKKEGLLYYKNDTHWNALGGYYGYRSLIRSLPYVAAPLERHELRESKRRQRSGDLGRMLIADEERSETIIYQTALTPRAQLDAESSANTQVYHQADTTLPRVFFAHDSYLMDFEPLYAEHFSVSTFDRGFRDFHSEKIQESGVDLVINEFVERSLIGAPPRNDWPMVQEYWGHHYKALPRFATLEGLSFAELIPALQRLHFPKDKIPVLRIISQPEQTDKLVITYNDGTGYYWLRAEGDIYYLEYHPDKVRSFRVEQNTACTIQVEVRLF